ncbi:MAG: hypothetical protein ACFFG0_01970 [Candidatus Thorarchaeota archaeon]
MEEFLEKNVILIYKKERGYQRACFGEYQNIKSLNFASFLNFIRTYLNKAEKAYSEKWDYELPEWMNSCKEMQEDSTAPVQAYAEIIKVMTLAGAALETFTTLNPDSWRSDPDEGRKWKE